MLWSTEKATYPAWWILNKVAIHSERPYTVVSRVPTKLKAGEFPSQMLDGYLLLSVVVSETRLKGLAA